MSQPGEVLVVDGDASIRSLLEVVVRMLPRRPVVAVDGRSAVALLANHTFDAIVLDLILPELSGFQVLEFVAGTAPELLARTIVLTTVPESRLGHGRGDPGLRRHPAQTVLARRAAGRAAGLL